MSDLLSARIDSFIDRLRDHWEIPGLAIAVIQKGDPVHVRAYGIRDIKTSQPVNLGTRFAIASCSKALTATAAAMLCDDGRLGWDDPVRSYLPEFRLYDPWVTEHVTVRDLLCCRVGLSQAALAESSSDWNRAEVLRRACEVPPAAGFRDQFCYSNMGFIAGAAVLEVAAGTTFEHLIEERVFRSLGMTASTVADSPWNAAGNVAMPHYRVDGQIRTVKPLPLDNMMGAASVTLSASDAARWLRFHLAEGRLGHETVVSTAALAETHRLQSLARDRSIFDGYGMGWVIGAHEDKRNLYHEGAIRGALAAAHLIPDDGYGCLVAVNSSENIHHVRAVVHFIRSLLVGKASADPIEHFDAEIARHAAEGQRRLAAEREAEPVSSRWRLEQFAGIYRHSGLGVMGVEPSDDDLLWMRLDHASALGGPLVRYADTFFEFQGDENAFDLPLSPHSLQGSAPSIRFHEEKGRIIGLDWRGMWFGDVSFTREPIP